MSILSRPAGRIEGCESLEETFLETYIIVSSRHRTTAPSRHRTIASPHHRLFASSRHRVIASPHHNQKGAKPMPMLEPMQEDDWSRVATIYREGIATGNATFATAPPDSWAAWSAGKLNACSIVARDGPTMVGWAAVSPTSSRACYAGVVEHSIYVAQAARGRGIGAQLLIELIRVTEAQGIWMIQSSIFPENAASLALHARHGFRVVGRRERIARMEAGPYAGQWRDTVLIERRSADVGR